MSNIQTLFLSGAFSAVLTTALVFLFRNWISQRIKSSIEHEYSEKSKAIDFAYNEKIKAIEFGYNQQIEKLKVELQGQSATSSARLAAELEHDKQMFNKLNAIVDEITFRDVCNGIANYCFYDYEPYHKLESLKHYGGQVEYQFLNNVLRKEFSNVVHTLSDFTAVVAKNFFSTTDNRYMLYPEIKNYPELSEERQTYNRALDETGVAADNVLAAYEQYRQQVKTILFI